MFHYGKELESDKLMREAIKQAPPEKQNVAMLIMLATSVVIGIMTIGFAWWLNSIGWHFFWAILTGGLTWVVMRGFVYSYLISR